MKVSTAVRMPGNPYEPPKLVELGKLHEVTLGCDKHHGGSDGFTFHGQTIVCASH